MKVKNPIPSDKVSEFVQSILVIENFQVRNPFVLPLNATGSLLTHWKTFNMKVAGNKCRTYGKTVSSSYPLVPIAIGIQLGNKSRPKYLPSSFKPIMCNIFWVGIPIISPLQKIPES